MFIKKFVKTDEPMINQLSSFKKFNVEIPAGAYNHGLLHILDEKAGGEILSSWDWLFGKKCLGLVTTGIGEVFYWKESSKEIYYFNPQAGESEYIDDDPEWFINEFLIKRRILEEVMWEERIDQLIHQMRPLRYKEAFILEPWIMLGGEEKIENYGVGDCEVYLDLVGRTFKKINS